MNRSRAQQQHPRSSDERCEREVSVRRRVSHVVRFVHDDEIVPLSLGRRAMTMAQVVRIRPAQRLERDYVRNCSRCRERITPHRSKRGGDDDQATRVLLGDRGCNVGLTHTNIIAEQRSTELFQSGAQACCRRNLVRLE